MSYPYPHQQQYPSQPAVHGQPPTGGVPPQQQQWGGQQPPASGQWGQPATGGGPPQQWGGQQPAGPTGQQPQQQQWGQPATAGGQPPQQQQWGQPQPQPQQWSGQPQGYPGGQPPQQPGTGYPGQAGAGGPPPQGQQQQQPPGSYQPPPTQPPSNFQGWYTQYYHQISPQEMQQVRQWFMSMDRDRSGSISANELANVAIGGVPIGFETAVKLIRVFDVDKNGTIDFYEYGALHKFLLSMQALFQQQDRDRNGRLDANEIGAALSAGGFRLGPVAAQSVFRKYNKSGYGISTVEFLGLVAHVAQVKSLFEWRDKQKTGQLTLDMDALLEITSDF